MVEDAETLLHGCCVAWQGRGLLILGASGSGKSTLAVEMMAFGAALVADDRVLLRQTGGGLVADCPESIRGRIEARRVGILNADPHGPVLLALAVDLSRPEPQRLPDHHKLDLLGHALPLVLGQGRDHLAPVLLQYLKAGRWDPEAT
ncbi:serine kinase [Paracoccus limosus]|uniref:Serine kinase n=1 Tax=Paracoccus limosus TaxID=913252 RepID=A0A844H2X9_9RHOB|nr:HPr kinase/phosphatase C-terminal domain-containing protein [Paracoccus limosus]MTH33863.1 serine kinase [Paracoccus limosus]